VETCDDQGQWTIVKSTCNFVCLERSCGGECVPGDKRCLSTTMISECDDTGAWVPRDCGMHACVTSVTSTCEGVCRPGSTTCMNGHVFTCGNNGVWALQMRCQYPDLVCVASPAPACGSNPDVTLGNDVAANASATITGDTLYLTRVSMPATSVDVSEMGLVGPSGNTFLTADFAVYDDNNGRPSARLMELADVPLGPGRQTKKHAACAFLPPGKPVWVGIVIPADLPNPPPDPSKPSWGFVMGPTQILYRQALVHDTAFPATLPTSLNPSTGVGLPVFLVVKERYDCQ
jgi:hypothetical protein